MGSVRRVPLAISFLALTGVIITVLLGNWQMGRAREKAAAQAQVQSARSAAPVHLGPEGVSVQAVSFRRVEVAGRWQDQHTILLDNRLRTGVPGYEVLTPLLIGPASAVLINRGWVKASPDRSVLPEVPATIEPVTLTGLALPVTARFVELSTQTVSGRVWQNLDFEKYGRHTGLQLLPLVIQLETEMPDGLARDWPPPDLRIDTNRAYAMQWYTMAAAIIVIYLIFYVRRQRA